MEALAITLIILTAATCVTLVCAIIALVRTFINK